MNAAQGNYHDADLPLPIHRRCSLLQRIWSAGLTTAAGTLSEPLKTVGAQQRTFLIMVLGPIQ